MYSPELGGVPGIDTDGEVESTVERIESITSDGGSSDLLAVCYRGSCYRLAVEGGRFEISDEIDTNRNARYRAVFALPDMSATQSHEMILIWRVIQ